MTEKEAIEILEQQKKADLDCMNKAIDVAIEAVKEVLQYRSIGSIEQLRNYKCLSLVSRPAKYEFDNGTVLYECNNCRSNMTTDEYDEYFYCPKCGQRLWRDDDE